ncbi:hypothetical protein [Streptomyces galbus]|uniref:hypothetical protein n=1 Tax=Streptomyces galbus TaxID=33898 RepID=UPI003EB6CDB6
MTPAPAGPRWGALRDRPYLLLTALDGLMAVQFKVLTVAVPLWLVGQTDAPRWLVFGTMLTGTVIVVLFGVFGLGAGLAETLGPGLLIALCIGWGRPGWYVVGVLFALTGAAAPVAVRRARRAERSGPVAAVPQRVSAGG